MKIKILMFSVISLLLSGCSSRFYYGKDGVSEQEFNKDTYECAKDSMTYSSNSTLSINGSNAFGSSSSGDNIDSRLMKLCLKSKGYTISDKPLDFKKETRESNRQSINKSRELTKDCENPHEFSDGYIVCLDLN